MLTAKAVLTANIDMTDINHTPIGASTTYKYDGEFDGQHHVISNMIIDLPNQENVALFGLVRGNAVIKNIIIDSTCSIKGKNRVAGIIGCVQTKADLKLSILNCVNMAPIHAYSGVASGIIGAGQSKYPVFKMHNCVNTGAITTDATNNYTVAFDGWNKYDDSGTATNSQVWCCYNNGTLNRIDGGNNIFRGSNRSVLNTYDLVNTASNMQSQTNIPSGGFTTDDPLHSGELCYYLNHGIEMQNRADVSLGEEFTQDLSDPNSIPMPNATGPKVYQVADFYCDGTAKGTITYSNTDGGSRDPHQFNPATGFCTVCGALNEEFVAVSADGFYHLSTVAQVEWFSQMVRLGHHGGMDVKLDADIDFGGVPNAHLPIGTNGHKYWGHFDGQGHRIIGMVLNNDLVQDNAGYDGKGFFGSVRGGGTDDVWNVTKNNPIIENLIIDESCSIVHNQNFAAGVVAHINSTNSGVTIIIRNCGNEANVTTSGKNAAGILGCVEATNVGLKLYNLWNKGNITGNAGESAAICAWTGQRNVNGEVDVEGCWNIGEVTGIDDNHYNMIRRNSNIVPRNIVDLCIANGAKGNQGTVSAWNTSNPISSGELCYLLNGDQSTIVYTQTLGTDAMPVYGTTSQQVYASGLRCDGAGIGFTNTETDISSLEPPHHTPKTNGFCSVCNQNTITSLSEENGYLLVGNAGELEFLSSIVNAASGAVKKVKLTADIDMDGVTHTPIGVDDGNKFCGEFDGQGHRILNMKSFSQNVRVGLFGGLRGAENTTIKNVIIDKSCKITGTRQMGAIAGACQTAISPLYLINCINEADVEGTGYQIAGMIGENLTDNLEIHITNCGNSGSIKAGDANSCAIFGWARPGNTTIENFWNTGTIVKGPNDSLERDGHAADQALAFNFYNAHQDVMKAGTIVLTNCYDASASAQRSQGTILEASAASSGELTYKLNGDQNNIVWKQTLGTDEHPVFSGSVVNAGKWFNDATDDVYYNLENGNYTVYQLNMSDTQTKYAVPANVTAQNVSIARNIPADEWIGLCLPFALETIPSGWDVRELTSVTGSGENASMKFSSASTIEAGKPYIVNPSAEVTTITAENKTIATATSTVEEGDVNMIGNFAQTAITTGSYYINTSSQLKKLTATSATLKGFRAYFTVDGSSGVKALSFDFEDDATGIENLNVNDNLSEGAIYNLAGQRLNKAQKGINIINGKKILK